MVSNACRGHAGQVPIMMRGMLESPNERRKTTVTYPAGPQNQGALA